MSRHRPRHTPRPPWKQSNAAQGTRPYTLHPAEPPINLTDEQADLVQDIFGEIAAAAYHSAAFDPPAQTLILFAKETL